MGTDHLDRQPKFIEDPLVALIDERQDSLCLTTDSSKDVSLFRPGAASCRARASESRSSRARLLHFSEPEAYVTATPTHVRLPATGPPEPFFVRVGGERVEIEREVFDLLFENSHRRTYAPILAAQASGAIALHDLTDHARAAQIPLPLFFAPYEIVAAQVAHKTQALLAGSSKTTFSMSARNPVRISDVELIIKDLLRKQQLLKRLDQSMKTNEVLGCLRSRHSHIVAEDANRLRGLLNFDLTAFRAERNKEASLEHLIRCLEAKQLLVSRNQPGYMLQTVPRGVSFSGLAVKDAKVPYLFLGSADDHYFEPAGRKIFTLALLATLVAYGKFAPVSYTETTKVEGTPHEYKVAAEMLMPAHEVTALSIDSLDDAKAHAGTFRVTPSAFVMHAWRLKIIEALQAQEHLDDLRREWDNRKKKTGGGSAAPLNAVRSYCGAEYFARMTAQLGAGRIDANTFRREVCLNKVPLGAVRDLRASA